MATRAIGDVVTAPPSITETVAVPPAAASAAPAPAAVVTDVAPPTTAPAAAPVEEPPPPVAVSGVLQLRPTEESWVEVIDARGKSLIARLVQPGESVGLDGVMPFKVKIGNANATQVVFRGQPLELGPFTRDNMAKLELK